MMAKHAVEKAPAKGKKKATAIIISVIIVVIIAAIAVLAVATSGFKGSFPEGTTINGVNVAGMGEIEAVNAVQAKFRESNSDTLTVRLSGDYSFEINKCEVMDEPDFFALVDQAADKAGGAFADIRNMFGKISVSDEAYELNAEKIRAKVDAAISEAESAIISSTIEQTDKDISITKGASSISFDADTLCEKIVKAFNNGKKEIEFEGTVNKDEEIGLEAIFESINSEAVDAYYDSEKGEIVPEVKGISFDMAKAQKAWSRAEYGEVVTIPLVVSEPLVTEEYLKEILFRDKLSSKTTTLKGSSSNRINNVTKACASLNGLIINPGETFDYNATLGERTKENGYLMAGAYENGQTVSQYGGGICQVSSMTYYCTLYANLMVNTRTNHMFPVAYMEPGLDATVSWGGPEYRFTNNRDYPIKIVAYVEDTSATVEFWGSDIDGSYVEMQYYTYSNFDKEYTDVVTGYSAVSTRCVYDKDGNLISRNREAYSSYNYHDEDIKWPPEKTNPSESPSASISPDVTESPAHSATPEPTTEITPAPSETPAATDAPAVTETPTATEVPAATETPVPEQTQEPAATEAPQPVEPVETQKPEAAAAEA